MLKALEEKGMIKFLSKFDDYPFRIRFEGKGISCR